MGQNWKECKVGINGKRKSDRVEGHSFANDNEFQQLSHQLFASPGPFVNLSCRARSGSPSHQKKVNNCKTSEASLENRQGQQISFIVGRCLICYSVVGVNKNKNEDSGNLLEFLTNVLSMSPKSNENNVDATPTDKYLLEEAVTDISKAYCSPLCCTCDNVRRQWLSKQRAIRTLQQEINELRQKIVAAVLLSMELTKKKSAGNHQAPSQYVVSLNKIRKLIGEKRPKLKLPLSSSNQDGPKVRTSSDSAPVVDWNLSSTPEAVTGDFVDISPHPIDIKIEFNNFKQVVQASTTSPSSPNLHVQKSSSSNNQSKGSSSSSTSSSSHDDNDDDVSSDDEYTGKKQGKKQTKKGTGKSCNPWREVEGKLFYKDIEVKKDKDNVFLCPFKCPHSRYETRCNIARHLRRIHLGNKSWREQEGKLFYKDIEIKKGQDDRYLCPFECLNRSYDVRSHLVRHLNLFHLEKRTNGFECDICGAKLCNRAGLYRHKKVKHRGIKPHACPHCGKKFGKIQELNIHERKHTGERPFACHLCPSRFTARVCLTQHIRLQHLEGTKQEAINPSNRSKAHKLEHAFPCDMCSIRFSSLIKLKRHKRVVHYGIKPHSCAHCGKKFAEKANLKLHLRVHTLEKPYSCDICSERFGMKRGLNLHMLNRHPEEAPEEETAESQNEYVLGY